MKDLIICFIVLLILCLSYYIRYTEHFNANHIIDYTKFEKKLNKYKGKKKYILVFSAGPTLKEFKKTDIPKYIWDDCYIVAVKNSINYLCDHQIKPDFLVTNFIGAAGRINIDLIDKFKPLFIGLDVGGIPKLREKTDFMVSINWRKNNMVSVVNNVTDIHFINKDNKIHTGWGHIMMELAIPLCIYLKPTNIITIGWDAQKATQHWNTINKETFTNWSGEDAIINKFSVKLYKYLLDNYNIKINKHSRNSGIKIPLIKF